MNEISVLSRIVPDGFKAVVMMLLWLLESSSMPIAAQAVDPSKLPPVYSQEVDYERDILPIFAKSCVRCHGAERPKSGYRLDQPDLALKPGDYGPNILIGNSEQSPLVHYVARLVEDMEMPPKLGEALSAESIGKIRRWIDDGAVYREVDLAEAFKPSFSFQPMTRFVTVEGDQKRFMANEGIPEGWGGGLERFYFKQRITDTRRVELEGKALFPEDRVRLKLGFEEQGQWYVKGGLENRRYYDDDSGVFVGIFVPRQVELGRELELDAGRLWLEAGRYLSSGASLRLGYEYAYRDGDKRSGVLGDLTDGAFNTRSYLPGVRRLDEGFHRLELGVEHTIGGYHFIETLDVELGEIAVSDTIPYSSAFTMVPDSEDQLIERYEDVQVANALSMDKRVKSWLYLSAGYLFHRVEGDGFVMRTSRGGPFPVGPWQANDIVIDQKSHVFNANLQLGPWEGWSLITGLQNDWTRQDGLGTVLQDAPTAARALSDTDTVSVDERFRLQFAGWSSQTIYAEAIFRQERQDYAEVSDDLFESFARDTDMSGDDKNYALGWRAYPFSFASVDLSAEKSLRQADFNHGTDTYIGGPGVGYSAFIRTRDTAEDALNARINLRWASWWKTQVYARQSWTDYRTAVDSLVDPFLGELSSGGGVILAGDSHARDLGFSTSLTRWRRLSLSANLLYRDSEVWVASNGVSALAPYQGDSVIVGSNLSYYVNETTDVALNYHFSSADYSQGNETTGLPLGLDYHWHQALLSVGRNFQKGVKGRLGYAFSDYHEPYSAGLNDYRSHGVFASVQFVWN